MRSLSTFSCRLVGSTPCQFTLCDGVPGRVGDTLDPDWEDTRHFVRNLLRLNPKLQSLHFGRSYAEDAGIFADSDKHFMGLSYDFLPNSADDWQVVLSTARSLRLPARLIEQQQEDIEGFSDHLSKLLAFSSTTLENFELYSVAPYSGKPPK